MIPVKVKGFDNQSVEVKLPGFVSNTKLYLNGRIGKAILVAACDLIPHS